MKKKKEISYFKNFSETRERNENFGSSLLLANSPMSPKIVNGSFAAIYDAADVFNECMKTFGRLRLEARDSPGTRLCFSHEYLFFLKLKYFDVIDVVFLCFPFSHLVILLVGVFILNVYFLFLHLHVNFFLFYLFFEIFKLFVIFLSSYHCIKYTLLRYYFTVAMRRRIKGILMSGKQFSLDSRMDLVQVCVKIQHYYSIFQTRRH